MNPREVLTPPTDYRHQNDFCCISPLPYLTRPTLPPPSIPEIIVTLLYTSSIFVTQSKIYLLPLAIHQKQSQGQPKIPTLLLSFRLSSSYIAPLQLPHSMIRFDNCSEYAQPPHYQRTLKRQSPPHTKLASFPALPRCRYDRADAGPLLSHTEVRDPAYSPGRGGHPCRVKGLLYSAGDPTRGSMCDSRMKAAGYGPGVSSENVPRSVTSAYRPRPGRIPRPGGWRDRPGYPGSATARIPSSYRDTWWQRH